MASLAGWALLCAVAGLAVALHGMDVAVAGYKALVSGETQATMTVQGLEAAGVPPDWADGIGAQAVVASEHAADSYLLGTNALLQNDPVVTIDAFNTGAAAGAMTLSVTVTDGEGGDEVTIALDKVKALIKATKDLSDWDGEGKLTPTLGVSGDKITVSSGDEPVMFLKLEK
ncbi:MAG: hypothetical protein IKO64_04570 [Kiritimatiellae bacterium]|nr:hypothetical protein [Kiritimatiellia bacterium]